MKAKYLGTLLVILTFIGCDDNTGILGLGMLPDSDKLSVKTETFPVHTRSFLADSVFAKTSIGYVGKFTDPHFGFYEASFLTQINCTENFKFPDVYSESNKEGYMAGDSLIATELILSFDTYKFFGDSLNPARMSVYELDMEKDLEKNHYTTFDVDKYYKSSDLLGRKAYTASMPTEIPMSYTDTIYGNSSDLIRRCLFFTLPKEFGERMLRHNREHPEDFKDSDSFIDKVFKGIYLKSDLGDGTVLYIDEVELSFIYNVHVKDSLGENILKKKDGTDSIRIVNSTMAATKEVIQANRFTNSERLEELAKEEEHTYIKSPAGIFTQATLPIDEIYAKLHSDTLNSVKLKFTGYQPEESDIDENFQMKTPQRVLLVREKEMKSFFENNSLADDITSYLTAAPKQGEDVRSYTFNNITYLINKCIDEKEKVRKNEGKDWTDEQWKEWEKETKWNSILLVPVIVNTDGQQSTSIISIQNDMKPGYIKLQGGTKDILELEVHYTVFH